MPARCFLRAKLKRAPPAASRRPNAPAMIPMMAPVVSPSSSFVLVGGDVVPVAASPVDVVAGVATELLVMLLAFGNVGGGVVVVTGGTGAVAVVPRLGGTATGTIALAGLRVGFADAPAFCGALVGLALPPAGLAVG